MKQVVIRLKQREWQKPLVQAYRGGIKRGMVVAHRRAGKDRVSLFVELEQALKQRCEIWHTLPEYKHARKVIWDAITGDGERLLDAAFPKEIIAKRHEDSMMIEFVNGSIWRLVGADNFNSLVGSNPKHVTFSEFALTHPGAWDYIRPILAENGGTMLAITTPRGYNHAFDMYQLACKSEQWYAAMHPVSQTKLIPEDVLRSERESMPDEMYRQEYECDFSASNVGSILGRYIEQAERDGRIGTEEAMYDPEGFPVDISSDIGFKDSASWWFWQRRANGYALVNFDTDSGLEAADWISRLEQSGYPLGTIWLPHDAKAKTFATKRSAIEQFLEAQISESVKIVPQVKVLDRINAARMVLPQCHFAPACERGLKGLRSWAFKYDVERKTFSKDPDHDWASHDGDAFSYGSLVMRSEAKAKPVKQRPANAPAVNVFTLDDLFNDPRTNPALR